MNKLNEYPRKKGKARKGYVKARANDTRIQTVYVLVMPPSGCGDFKTLNIFIIPLDENILPNSGSELAIKTTGTKDALCVI